MNIHKTKNYSMFSYMNGNRAIVGSHVKKLQNSIAKENLLSINPIIVNKEYEVIDGQHRLEAAGKLGVDIYYIVLDTGSLSHVQLLNEHMKKWSVQDYVDSYVSLNYQDYIILDDFSKKFNLPIGICLELLGDKKYGTYSSFKGGEFKVNGVKVAEETAINLMDFTPFVDSGVLKSTDFVRTIRYLTRTKRVKIQELIRKLNASNKKIHREANTKKYLRVLEDIYNYRLKNPVRFY